MGLSDSTVSMILIALGGVAIIVVGIIYKLYKDEIICTNRKRDENIWSIENVQKRMADLRDLDDESDIENVETTKEKETLVEHKEKKTNKPQAETPEKSPISESKSSSSNNENENDKIEPVNGDDTDKNSGDSGKNDTKSIDKDTIETTKEDRKSGKSSKSKADLAANNSEIPEMSKVRKGSVPEALQVANTENDFTNFYDWLMDGDEKTVKQSGNVMFGKKNH